MGLSLRLMGEFALEDCGVRVGVPTSSQRLMAFLALRGPSHRCLVAGMLWPEVPEPQALASLRTAVWRMNKAHPQFLDCDGVQLKIGSQVGVDVEEHDRFTTHLLREHFEDQHWITEHWDLLWRGDLLLGWYDDWVTFERERHHQLRLHALEYLAQCLTRRGDLSAALHLALEAVRVEPLRETATATLIEVYLAEGNLHDALVRYDSFRSLSLRELGLEPSAHLTDLLPRGVPSLTRR